ncbi:MAG: glycosyltransferase family 9 protein [Armatimonadetes bacterium]|nr:glycosyltransferase family 9 protein [Armatimonadota bacterium]
MSKRVLVYQIGALGDTIVSIPAYRAIRRNMPGAHVQILQAQLAPGRVSPSDLLVREGLVDSVLSYPLARDGSGLKTRLSAWWTTVIARPDVIVYIGPAERTPEDVRRDRLFFRMTGFARLVGFHAADYASYQKRDAAGLLPPMPAQSKMRLDRLALDGFDTKPDDLRLPLLHPDRSEQERALEWLSARRRHPDRKLLAMGIGSAQGSTKWPLERFEAVGKAMLDAGSVEIVVVGGPAEKEAGEGLVAAWGDGLVAAGEFDAHGSAALLKLADLYVGLNTGTTHVASAAGAAIVALYSDHNQPGEWDPMGEGHTLIDHRGPCGGCRVTECHEPGHPCMNGIQTGPVIEALTRRIKEA